MGLHAPHGEKKRACLAASPERLVVSGVAEKFSDAVEWQREVRRDKSLYGRDEDDPPPNVEE